MAKKKMTKAQAAAARREVTPESIKREKAKERTRLIKESAQAAQKQASKSAGTRAIMPLVIVAVIIVAALALTIGPGFLMGR